MVSNDREATVHRLHGGQPLSKYLLKPGRDVTSTDLSFTKDKTECLIRYGYTATAEPPWVSHAISLTSLNLRLPRTAPFAVLLINEKKWVYALTWGDGYLMLDQENYAEQSFGLGFAIRRLDEFRVGSMTLHALDTSARMAQITYPRGADVARFGVRRYGELVTRLRGSADLTGLTYSKSRRAKKDRIIEGADSLKIPVGRDFSDLRADLAEIARTVDASSPENSLRSITQIRPLKTGSPTLPALRKALSVALQQKSSSILDSSFPIELSEHANEIRSLRILSLGRGGRMHISPDQLLRQIKSRVFGLDVEACYETLRKGSIHAYSDEEGTEQVGGTTSALKWVTFEKSLASARYILRSGKWYTIGENYLNQITEEVTSLLANKYDTQLPHWTPTGQRNDENLYNELAAKSIDGLCLDAKFASTPQNKKIELCDIYTNDHALIHVKWLGRASAFSHLLAQAEASINALNYEPEARTWLKEQIETKSESKISPSDQVPSTIVLACGGRVWSANSLFAMSQINLLSFAHSLPNGVELKFLDIPYTKKASEKRV